MGKLYLTCGDFILNSNNMDAIVNAQNKYMQYGSGICGAICRASGNELIEYCQNTYKEYMVNGLYKYFDNILLIHFQKLYKLLHKYHYRIAYIYFEHLQ